MITKCDRAPAAGCTVSQRNSNEARTLSLLAAPRPARPASVVRSLGTVEAGGESPGAHLWSRCFIDQRVPCGSGLSMFSHREGRTLAGAESGPRSQEHRNRQLFSESTVTHASVTVLRAKSDLHKPGSYLTPRWGGRGAAPHGEAVPATVQRCIVSTITQHHHARLSERRVQRRDDNEV